MSGRSSYLTQGRCLATICFPRPYTVKAGPIANAKPPALHPQATPDILRIIWESSGKIHWHTSTQIWHPELDSRTCGESRRGHDVKVRREIRPLLKGLKIRALQFAGTNLKRDLTSITTSNTQIQGNLSPSEKHLKCHGCLLGSLHKVKPSFVSSLTVHVSQKGTWRQNTISRQLLGEPGV